MALPEPLPLDQRECLVQACVHGSFCCYALVQAIEHGVADLRIDRSAWENTMAALVWALSSVRAGREVLRGIHVEEHDVERVRRLHALGAAALAGGERSPELLPLAEHYLRLWGGPDWRRAYGKVLGAECNYPLGVQSDAAVDTWVSDQDEVLHGVVCALVAGADLLAVLTRSLDRGCSDLALDPYAWQNTLTALEWAVMQGLTTESLGMHCTEQDLERVRRVHSLGSSALAGEAASPELLPLARQCSSMLHALLHSVPPG